MGRARRLGLVAAIACACVALDQWTKHLALAHLEPGRPQTLVPGVMDLLLVRNTGAAFSIGEGAGWLFVLVAIAVVAVVVLAVWRRDDLPVSLLVCAGLVAGGGVGNLVDRVARGWVCDFFATTFVDFAVFNVADVFVCCGVALGLVCMLRWDDQAGRDSRAKDGRAARAVARKASGQGRAGAAHDAVRRLRDRKGGR